VKNICAQAGIDKIQRGDCVGFNFKAKKGFCDSNKKQISRIKIEKSH